MVTSKIELNEDLPSFSDPEDFLDDISNDGKPLNLNQSILSIN